MFVWRRGIIALFAGLSLLFHLGALPRLFAEGAYDEQIELLKGLQGSKEEITRILTLANTACDHQETIVRHLQDRYDIESTGLQDLVVEEDDSVRSARDVVTIMAQLLLADGKTEVAEIALLEKIAATYGMKQEDLNSIIWNLKQGEVYIPAPDCSKEAWNLLLSATRMALADDVLTPSEERELEILAQHLGYGKTDVQRAIKAEKTRKFTEEQEAQRRANIAKLNTSLSQNSSPENSDHDVN